jgi:hypothetical protein
MDGLQPIHGQFAPGDAIGCGVIGRDGFVVQGAKGYGLTDSVATGGAGLGDLPNKGPKDKVKRPSARTGEVLFILLRETVRGNPRGANELELMKGALSQAPEVAGVVFEITGPGGKERSKHKTVYTLSLNLTF